MVLRQEAEPLQVGAFLMLLRVKEETPDELAGFVEACRAHIRSTLPHAALTVDLDWPSYAGKKHQHPWFLLAALLLAESGYRVALHGAGGHTPGRLYTPDAMRALGLPVVTAWDAMEKPMTEQRIAYIGLSDFCPALDALLQLKPLLGLRSPVNTLARLLNPLGADASLQSVFHPAYCASHQQANQLLGQANALAFKGESGELEIKPTADTQLWLLRNGVSETMTLPRAISERMTRVEQPAVEPLITLWREERTTPSHFGEQAVLQSCAAALLVLEPQITLEDARAHAIALWQSRDRTRLNTCPSLT